MTNVICYDSDGNVLESLTQWDVGQSLVIKGISSTITPTFHFCNKRSTRALVVPSEVNADGIGAKIPNILLQDGIPLIAYIYYQKNEDSARTMYTVTIPVTPRTKPFDYEYEENIGYTNWVEIEEEARALLSQMSDAVEETRNATQNANNATTELISAAGNANTAAGNANQAAESANKSAGSANTAASSANTAANNANSATSKANSTIASIEQKLKNGELNGVSVTHEWEGTILKVTSASGTSSANLKGTDGVGVVSVIAQYCQQAIVDLEASTGATIETATDEQIELALTGAEWEPSVPSWKDEHYIWKRLVVTYTNGLQTKTSPVCITGPKGNTGAKGDKGDVGDDGKDGTSVTHEWSGTTLKVTSASGTSSANLKGDKGDKGDPGVKGDKGDTGETGSKGDKGDTGLKGDTGDTGATFTPSVSADGVISWTNDKGLDNPPSVDISVGMTNLTVSIPITAWINDPSFSDRYIYYADVSNSAIVESQYPVGSPSISCLSEAQNCGLAPIAQTLAGKIRFYSESIPNTILSIDLALWKK